MYDTAAPLRMPPAPPATTRTREQPLADVRQLAQAIEVAGGEMREITGHIQPAVGRDAAGDGLAERSLVGGISGADVVHGSGELQWLRSGLLVR
jgi:hypothetical protein